MCEFMLGPGMESIPSAQWLALLFFLPAPPPLVLAFASQDGYSSISLRHHRYPIFFSSSLQSGQT